MPRNLAVNGQNNLCGTFPPSSWCPQRRWSGEGVGVGMLRGAGDYLTLKFLFGHVEFGLFQFEIVQFEHFQFGRFCSIG